MTVHPLWRSYEIPDQEQTDAAFVAGAEPRVEGGVEVVAYNAAWPTTFTTIESLVRDALGVGVLAIEHVGSTSVPGIPAKPIIDIDLTVADPADEDSYVPALERAGFTLRVREPDWEGHRMLRLDEPTTNLHVFGPDAGEPQRHVLFRDWLRAHSDDREAYGALKAELATRRFSSVMAYNAAKAPLIYEIYERLFAADPSCAHVAQPLPNER